MSNDYFVIATGTSVKDLREIVDYGFGLPNKGNGGSGYPRSFSFRAVNSDREGSLVALRDLAIGSVRLHSDVWQVVGEIALTPNLLRGFRGMWSVEGNNKMFIENWGDLLKGSDFLVGSEYLNPHWLTRLDAVIHCTRGEEPQAFRTIGFRELREEIEGERKRGVERRI